MEDARGDRLGIVGDGLGVLGARQLVPQSRQPRRREQRPDTARLFVGQLPHGVHGGVGRIHGADGGGRRVDVDAQVAAVGQLRAVHRDALAVLGRGGQVDELAVALDPEAEGPAGGVLDGVGHGVGVGEVLAVDRHDGVADPQAGQGRRRRPPRPVLEGGHVVVVRRLPEGEDQDEGQHERDEEMHGRAGGRHDDPLVEGLLAVGPGLVLLRDLLGGGEPDDPHVPAGGDGLDAVFGLAPPDRPQPGAEADEVLRDLHAGPLGRDEVPELVQHDDGEQDGDEEEQVAPAKGDEDGGDQGQGDERAGPPASGCCRRAPVPARREAVAPAAPASR